MTGEELLRSASPNFRELLKADSNAPDGVRAPRPGEIFTNKNLAATLRSLAANGKEGFYKGPVAESIVGIVQDLGGYISLEDLALQAELGSQDVNPISLRFRDADSRHEFNLRKGDIPKLAESQAGVELWECPPNGQGIIALMALGILERLEKTGKIRELGSMAHNSTE